MNRGGVESWLMHVLRTIDRRFFVIDFLVHTRERCQFDAEIEALGARIIRCPRPNGTFEYTARLRRALGQGGVYDVVHSHVHHYSGVILRTAQRAGVRVRIAHSHLDTRSVDSGAGFLRARYLRLTRRWIGQSATCKLAASGQAGESLFGLSTPESRWKMLPCGIDLQPFHTAVDRAKVRSELGIPPGALVIGHIGRFAEQKNHAFFLKIAAELGRRKPNAYFLMVGEGPLRRPIETQVAAMGMAGRFCFAGVRPDVPRLMLGAIDAFLFPSLYEGLPLVLVEAQAAGLPCLYSDVVDSDAGLVAPLAHRLSLRLPAGEWANALLCLSSAERALRQEEALRIVENSPFNINDSVARLQEVYAGA